MKTRFLFVCHCERLPLHLGPAHSLHLLPEKRQQKKAKEREREKAAAQDVKHRWLFANRRLKKKKKMNAKMPNAQGAAKGQRSSSYQLINQQKLKAISESFLLNLVNGVRSSSDRRPFWMNGSWIVWTGEEESEFYLGDSRHRSSKPLCKLLGGENRVQICALLSCETKIHPDDCVSFLEGTRRRCVLWGV